MKARHVRETLPRSSGCGKVYLNDTAMEKKARNDML
jgi:hypothetical protein